MQFSHKQHLAITKATEEAAKSSTDNQTHSLPTNFVEAIKIATQLKIINMSLTSQIEKLELQVDRDAVKVAFYDAVAQTTHQFDMDEASKVLGVGKTSLLQKLREQGILMSNRNRRNRPYQRQINAGRFDFRLVSCKNRSTGEIEIKTMPFVTGKGLIWIHETLIDNLVL